MRADEGSSSGATPRRFREEREAMLACREWLQSELGPEVMRRFVEQDGTVPFVEIGRAIVSERFEERARLGAEVYVEQALEPNGDPKRVTRLMEDLALVARYAADDDLKCLADMYSSHERAAVRGELAYVLGRSGKRSLAPYLSDLLTDSAPYVRQQAAGALVSMCELADLAPETAPGAQASRRAGTAERGQVQLVGSEATRHVVEPQEAAYQAMKQELERKHIGEYVALLDGQIVAQAGDLRGVLAAICDKQTLGQIDRKRSPYVRKVGEREVLEVSAPGPFLATQPPKGEQDRG